METQYADRRQITIKGVLFLSITFLLLFSLLQSAIAKENDEDFLRKVEYKTFLFLDDFTNDLGITQDSMIGNENGCSAASGFYLTSIPVAAKNGWITKDTGYNKALKTLNSYYKDEKNPKDFYIENEHGFYPHWFNNTTGKWEDSDCYSSVDTAILMAGVITVGQYYNGTEVENLSRKLYENVDWNWMLNGDDTLSMGWRPDIGFLSGKWEKYNEGILAVLLAMGSPTHPIPEQCWDALAQNYNHENYTHGNKSFNFVESSSTSLFTYQYPQIWFNLKGKRDRIGVDYFNNSVNATLENRAYCIENPFKHKGYGLNIWGLTACECPLHDSKYEAHGPDQGEERYDDGTIAPSGAGGSIIFTPIESIEALRYMNDTYGDRLWGKYGFKVAFNLENDWNGNPGSWFSPNYVSINQGAILTMIENYRSGLIQDLFMQSEYGKRALQKAEFSQY
jgi:hypothetical protein